MLTFFRDEYQVPGLLLLKTLRNSLRQRDRLILIPSQLFYTRYPLPIPRPLFEQPRKHIFGHYF